MRVLEQLMEKRLFKPRLPGYNSTNSALYCLHSCTKSVGTYHILKIHLRDSDIKDAKTGPTLSLVGLDFLNHNKEIAKLYS